MGNEVIKSTETQVALQTDAPLGFSDQITQEDLIIPRAKLYQGNPTEAQQYPDAKGGQVINSLTGEQLSGEFIPILQSFEWVRFNARNSKDPEFDPSFEPGALMWKTTDPKDPNVADNPDAWRCKTIKFLCWFAGQPMPLTLTFGKTSYAAGKKLLSIAKFSGKSLFEMKYRLSSKKEEKEGNIYYVLQVDPCGTPSEDELAGVRTWYSEFRGKAYKEHDEVVAKKDDDIAWKE